MNPAIKGRVADLGRGSALQVRGEFWPVLAVFSAGIGFAVLVRRPLRMRAQAARASRGPVGDFEVHSVALGVWPVCNSGTFAMRMYTIHFRRHH